MQGYDLRDMVVGGWRSSYLCSLRFIIFTFKITLLFARLYFKFDEQQFFFCHHNFIKESHSEFSKNKPENILSIKIT